MRRSLSSTWELKTKYLSPGSISVIWHRQRLLKFWEHSLGRSSQSKLQRGSSPLLPYKNEGKAFSEKFTLKEDFTLGLHPRFNSEGEVAEEHLELFKNGKLQNLLTSTATAKEFELESNFASGSEGLRSPLIETGELAKQDILKKLGTGLYISNLHYLNWSDLNKVV